MIQCFQQGTYFRAIMIGFFVISFKILGLYGENRRQTYFNTLCAGILAFEVITTVIVTIWPTAPQDDPMKMIEMLYIVKVFFWMCTIIPCYFLAKCAFDPRHGVYQQIP